MAEEASLIFLKGTEDKLITLKDRIKRLLGDETWKQNLTYNNELAIEAGYVYADKFIEIQGQKIKTENEQNK